VPTPKAGYTLNGEKIPSVTQIISRFKDSGGLLHWAFKQGKDGKERLYDESQKAADIGTCAHGMVELYNKGQVEAISDYAARTLYDLSQRELAFTAFESYLSWAQNFNVTILEQEVGLVSQKYKFGGTLDAVGLINNSLCLLDWKTSNAIYCHPPGTRVLTHDWRWVPVETLQIGDRLRAFTEDRVDGGLGGRHWQDSVVVQTGISQAPHGIRLILESGQQMISTIDHPYLARRSAGGRKLIEGGTIWIKAKNLRAGNFLPRYFDPWDTDYTYEAGWFAGLLDGEGSLSIGQRRKFSTRLGFAQNPGSVLNRARAFMASRQIEYVEAVSEKKCVQIRLNGGTREIARILGTIRPVRLLPKLNPIGALMTPKNRRDRIVAMELTGPIDVVNLTTTSGTYFAEGYGSHNTDYLIQVAAYGALWNENFPDRPITGGFHILRFSKDHGDFAHHYFANLDDGWRQFLLFREAFDIDKVLKKRAA
jgi:hypothetical protein